MHSKIKEISLFLGLIIILAVSVNSELIWTFEKGAYNQCMPSYKSTVWSNCTNGTQNRIAIDVAGCRGDFLEERTCIVENDEIQNLFLNTEPLIIISKESDRMYRGELNNSHYQYVYTYNESLGDGTFIIEDINTSHLHFARSINVDENGTYFYLIEEINNGLTDLLFSSGYIVDDATFEETYEQVQTQYYAASMMILIILIITAVFVTSFKRNRKKRKLVGVDPKESKPQDKEKPHETKHSSLFSDKQDKKPEEKLHGLFGDKAKESKEPKHSSLFNPEKQIKKEDIHEALHSDKKFFEMEVSRVLDYIKMNSFLTDDQIKDNLKKVGWKKDVIDEAFKRKH